MKVIRTPLESANFPSLGVRHAFRHFTRQLGGAVFPSILARPGTPVTAVFDARIIAWLADYTVFIVQWAKTPREAVRTAIGTLLGVSSHVGIVINPVNLAKHARYGHGDCYSRYRGYYGSVVEPPVPATRPPLTLAKR